MFKLLSLLTIIALSNLSQAAETNTVCYPTFSKAGYPGLISLSDTGSEIELKGAKTYPLVSKYIPGVMLLVDAGIHSQYNDGVYQRELTLKWSSSAKTAEELFNIEDRKLDANIYMNFSDAPGHYRTDVAVNKKNVDILSVRCESK
jgi:hypothetical protein